ncbi:MAG TPA: hypothetical protein PLG60_06800 [Acidimicrobiales bacterium]|nr:hypothetical protein [Acidimicrobiales bacterium]
MAADPENDEVFDEEELADGFDEEIVSDDIDDEEGDDVLDIDESAEDTVLVPGAVIVEESDDDDVVAEVVVVDDDDVIDDADVELALDEVLAETILRTTVIDDDEDGPVEVDPTLESSEAILPKQDDEFRCKSCRLLKKTSQLADKAHMLCRDCV